MKLDKTPRAIIRSQFSQKEIDYFFSNIDTSAGIDGCWNYKYLTEKGYGTIKLKKRHLFAHRLSYALQFGDPGKDKFIDHLCRNRRCVNPKHLESVSSKTNILRGEGHAAVNSKKNFCIRGHPFNQENTHIEPNRRRTCIICRRMHGLINDRKRRLRKKLNAS